MAHPLDLSELHRRQTKRIDALLAMTERQQLAIWKTLDAPPLAEMVGEFFGMRTLLGVSEESWNRAHTMWNPTSLSGIWLGKGFRATSDTTGEGYNRWSRVGGRIQRSLRFATHMGPSLIDGRPSLHLRYAAFDNRVGQQDLCDEIRRYDDEIYLCTATRAAAGQGRTAPTVFMLVGPGAPWRGVDDDGHEA